MDNKQKILIVDDTLRNLEEARTASGNFLEYHFVFFDNAFEALSEIVNAKEGDIRGVVTDLFFPQEKEMNELYGEYIESYDSCDHSSNPYKLRVPHNRQVLTESPFLAYGGVIVLQCFAWGIPVTLVTTMHRHISNVDDWIRNRRTIGTVGSGDPASNADATLILAPLIKEGVLNLDDVLKNRHPERYIGTSGGDKPWGEAISMCLSQETRDNRLHILAKEKKLRTENERQQDEDRRIQLEKEKELEHRKNLLSEQICGFKIADDLREQLLPHIIEGKEVKICSPEIALITIATAKQNPTFLI